LCEYLHLVLSRCAGVLGMPGRTAYVGIEILKPVVGQTLLVSGAAGAVGSLVLQLGKRKGARVVGIAGSADKCSFLASLGADATVNYRGLDGPALAAAISAACPSGEYWSFACVCGGGMAVLCGVTCPPPPFAPWLCASARQTRPLPPSLSSCMLRLLTGPLCPQVSTCTSTVRFPGRQVLEPCFSVVCPHWLV
jgi:hypothetical protein